MCGIAGWAGQFELEPERLQALIRHRGPDQDGIYQDDGLCLIHTRLSILDLSPLGRQPMASADGRYVIAYNGEIYNHLELREELEKAGFTFRSTSDTETLLYALAHWGTACLSRLNGIFAFAFYDKQQERLLLARDHFGVKPLYYTRQEEGLLFSSELKAVNQGISHPHPNAEALCNYLSFLWSPGELSPETSVKKLLPGHYLEVELRDLSATARPTAFYRLPFKGHYEYNTEAKALPALEEHLLRAVERQLLSDVPVGFFLSGGLDSSLIAAMARRITGQRLQCFTIDAGFTNASREGFADDLHYAQKVAGYLDVELEVVKADIDIIRDFDKMIWHLDEPQADAAPLNVLNIARRAREMGYKVLIGGTAGDDLFTGYRRHQAIQLEHYLRWVPRPVARLLQQLPLSDSHPTQRRLSKIIRQLHLPTAQRLANYFEWLPRDRIQNLFSSEYQEQIQNYRPTDFLLNKLEDIPNEPSWVNRMLYWEFSSFLPDHNLNYTDKLSMAEGVETRVPFLDVELVELSTRIHPKVKLKGQHTKYILKKVAEKYLPREVIYRPKTGFGAPVRKWITEDMRPFIAERLSPERLEERGIFNPDAVWQLIEDNQSGKIDASYSIWALLAVDSWYTQFVLRKPYFLRETPAAR